MARGPEQRSSSRRFSPCERLVLVVAMIVSVIVLAVLLSRHVSPSSTVNPTVNSTILSTTGSNATATITTPPTSRSSLANREAAPSTPPPSTLTYPCYTTCHMAGDEAVDFRNNAGPCHYVPGSSPTSTPAETSSSLSTTTAMASTCSSLSPCSFADQDSESSGVPIPVNGECVWGGDMDTSTATSIATSTSTSTSTATITMTSSPEKSIDAREPKKTKTEYIPVYRNVAGAEMNIGLSDVLGVVVLVEMVEWWL